jgi:ParB-like chromosome segregation protein Spo0J
MKRRPRKRAPQRATPKATAISQEANSGHEIAQVEELTPSKSTKKETMLDVWPANGGDVSIALTDKAMKIHPLCRLFNNLAPIPKEDRAGMLENIKKNGIKVPILLNKAGDTIIDGYNRWMIAYDLGFRKSQVPIERFKGKDEEVEGEILSRNLHRRHMTFELRKELAAKLVAAFKAELSASVADKSKPKRRGRGRPSRGDEKAIQKTAETLNVSPRTVRGDLKAAGVESQPYKPKKLKPKKPTTRSFEDEAWHYYGQWLNGKTLQSWLEKNWPGKTHKDVDKVIHEKKGG